MVYKVMDIGDYDAAFSLWKNTEGLGIVPFDDSREGIEKYLCRNPATSFAAYDGKRLAGTILCGHDGRRGFIYHLAVDASCRNRGVGKGLVARAVEALKNEGISKAALVAYSENEVGNAFWDAQGFAERGDIKYRDKFINKVNI